jgi:hypothetical protein
MIHAALALFLLTGTPPRQAHARDAAQAFTQVHLFEDGRGLHVTPGLYHLYDLVERPQWPVDFSWAFRRLGFNLEGRHVTGLFGADYRGSRVAVLGCVGCHSGRAAGRFVVGLGNKNIDVSLIALVAQAFARPFQWSEAFLPEHDRRLIEDVLAFTARLQDPRRTNRTNGLVPLSMIQDWFYRQAGREMPDDLPASWVKVPHLWGYEEKRRAGLFCDGFGDGEQPGWAAMVELACAQKPETVRRYRHRLEEVEQLFNEFLPPPYPFPVDLDLAASGRSVFQRTCASCHGSYRRDPQGLPIYEKPRHLPWNDVRTDADRLRSVTPEFRLLVATSELSDLIRGRTVAEPGYFAPRLEGIWARFPYLHNASVPNVRALLTPPPQRPAIFSLRDAGELHRFDPDTLGLNVEPDAPLHDLARRGYHSVYWTRRPGHSNQGHNFGTNLHESDKRALIEYLKTL